MSTSLSLSRAPSDATTLVLHEALAAQHEQVRALQAIVDDLHGQPDAEATGRDVAERALRTALDTVSEIDAALQRVEAGTYGRCVRCGEAVAPERLEALPHTAHCLGCAASAGGVS